MRRGEEGGEGIPRCPSLLHVTRKLNKKRHTYCPAHQETQLHSAEKLLHWDTHAATKRRPSGRQSLRSHTGLPPQTRSSPRFPARLVQTIAPRMCRALRTAQTHKCLPSVFQDALCAARGGQPSDVPTPREQKTHRVTAHGQILKLTREMDKKINDVARGSCLLHDVVGQQMKITSSIHRKCEDSQLEMGQTSNCRHERTHGSSRKLSDVNAKYWEVEPFSAIVMCHNTSNNKNDQEFATVSIRFRSAENHNKVRRQNCRRDALLLNQR